MLQYCRSVVDILRQACLTFNELLMSATGEQKEIVNDKGKKEMKWFGAMDPFDSVTIASVCMDPYCILTVSSLYPGCILTLS